MDKKRSYLDNFLRWVLWITVFGAGFHGGQLIMISLHGHFTTGLIIFVTGVMGYALAGVIFGALIAVVATFLPQIRIAPTSLGMGAIRVVAIGLALGIWSAFATKLPGMADEPVMSATACTADNIETAFQAIETIDNAIGGSAAPKSLVNKADHLWSITPDCEGSHPDFTDENRGKYIDVLLLGSADSVVIYYDANRVADAKKYLSVYFTVSDVGRKLGAAKGWSKMLSYIKTVDPLMDK